MPVIGFLSGGFPDAFADRVRAFHQGLGEAGYVEGRNIAIEYRWAKISNDRLPALAAELVRNQVSVIVAYGGVPGALAAKAATTTIPILFMLGGVDPVGLGLVTSLNRPGGNTTGVSLLNWELVPKQFELIHELLPAVPSTGLLVNPTNPRNVESATREAQAATRTLGLQVHVLQASTDGDLEAAFVTLAKWRAGALVIGPDPFFNIRSKQIAELTLRHRVPAIYQYREFVVTGGLMSYGSSLADMDRLIGNYTGRILKGEKAGDLPVQHPQRTSELHVDD